MTWIDERLFGWSRSAKRGTSAWGGMSGDETSRVGTPDDTDEEDTGDYDNVIGLIPGGYEQASAIQKSRSRQSSYADLQRLRLAPLAQPTTSGIATQASPAQAESTEGLHFRTSHRVRRDSLSDGVPVTRIAAEDRKASFAEATNHLNDENRRQEPENGAQIA